MRTTEEPAQAVSTSRNWRWVDTMVSLLERPRGYWSVAILLAAFYLETSLLISARRLLWFDEIFTVLMCRLPDIATMERALRDGAEQVPLLYLLLMRAFDAIFGH